MVGKVGLPRSTYPGFYCSSCAQPTTQPLISRPPPFIPTPRVVICKPGMVICKPGVAICKPGVVICKPGMVICKPGMAICKLPSPIPTPPRLISHFNPAGSMTPDVPSYYPGLTNCRSFSFISFSFGLLQAPFSQSSSLRLVRV